MTAPALLRAKDYSASAAETDIRSLLGGLLLSDWKQAMVARGFGWHTFDGAFSTPAAGGGATAPISNARPRLLLSLPSGYTMVPLRLDCSVQMPLTAADNDESEILFAVDRTQAFDGTGTSTALTPTNMRSDVVSGCPLTCAKTFSADITAAPSLGIELGHAVMVSEYQTDVNRNWTGLRLLYEPLNPPFIVGPAMLIVQFGGTIATTGFAQADVLVFASSLVTGLS